MSYVRLLEYSTLTCGCVVGRYREMPTEREVTYVEQKGSACACQHHRRNHTVRPATLAPPRTAIEHARAF
jgi:hypothetical protein